MPQNACAHRRLTTQVEAARLAGHDGPCNRGDMRNRLALLTLLIAIGWLSATSGAAGAWKHEVVANNGDELTYRDNGKRVFYAVAAALCCTSNFPGQPRKRARPASRSRPRKAA